LVTFGVGTAFKNLLFKGKIEGRSAGKTRKQKYAAPA
jgi:hypothetical protein